MLSGLSKELLKRYTKSTGSYIFGEIRALSQLIFRGDRPIVKLRYRFNSVALRTAGISRAAFSE